MFVRTTFVRTTFVINKFVRMLYQHLLEQSFHLVPIDFYFQMEGSKKTDFERYMEDQSVI
jgi:hypothetical protein